MQPWFAWPQDASKLAAELRDQLHSRPPARNGAQGHELSRYGLGGQDRLRFGRRGLRHPNSGAMQWLQQSLRASEKQQRDREVESLILPYYKNRDSGI